MEKETAKKRVTCLVLKWVACLEHERGKLCKWKKGSGFWPLSRVGVNAPPDCDQCQAVYTDFYEAVNVKKGLWVTSLGEEISVIFTVWILTHCYFGRKSDCFLWGAFTFWGNCNLIKPCEVRNYLQDDLSYILYARFRRAQQDSWMLFLEDSGGN
jgi:hypothetical protein